MTRKYTAADFANARFAEHEDGGLATRSGEGYYMWEVSGIPLATDEIMARDGWVPVPTKPTITRSKLAALTGLHDPAYTDGFLAGLKHAGIEIIPDPEPTNTDNLAELMKEIDQAIGLGVAPRTVAKYLNDHGVTAPNVKGN